MRKRDFPVDDVRRFLEPGPIVLVSSSWKGKTNIMTMGWHMVLGESPSLVGCFIWDQHHSFEMILITHSRLFRPTVRRYRKGFKAEMLRA